MMDIPESRTIIAIKALGELLASQGEHCYCNCWWCCSYFSGICCKSDRGCGYYRNKSRYGKGKPKKIEPPEPLPESLLKAISRVARDYNLPEDWMNTTVGLQWKTGLPPGFEARIHWHRFGGLWLGCADRYDLIFLKLYAAADSEGPSSVHYQDLIALKPTHEELDVAALWLRSQDPSPQFAHILEQVLEYAKRNR